MRKNLSETEEAKKRRQQGHRTRVREAADQDPELATFSETGILELFLYPYIPRRDTKQIAYDLLERFGTLFGVVNQSPAALCSVKGMTANAAFYLRMLPSFFRRIESSRMKADDYLNSADRAFKALWPMFLMRGEEICAIACLDGRDRLLRTCIVSRGGATSVPIDVKEILRSADLPGTTGIILAHNHPSDNVLPSDEDIAVTDRLVQALDSMNIRLVDHLIIGLGKFLSMRNARYMHYIYERYDRFNAMLWKDEAEKKRFSEPITYSVAACEYYPYTVGDVTYAKPFEEFPTNYEVGESPVRPKPIDDTLHKMLVSDMIMDPDLRAINEKIRNLGRNRDESRPIIPDPPPPEKK